MKKLKKEFFFLKRQLWKRFTLLLLGIVLCIIFNSICSFSAQTYTSLEDVPANHVGNVKTMDSKEPSFVTTRDDYRSMTTLLYKYNFENGKYNISFALPSNIAYSFTCYMLVMLIVSVVKRIEWYKRYTFAEANRKVDYRRQSMIALKEALNTSG